MSEQLTVDANPSRSSSTDVYCALFFDRSYTAVQPTQQRGVLQQTADVIADNVALVPRHMRPGFVAVSKGVCTMADHFPITTGPLAMGWIAHLWERD